MPASRFFPFFFPRYTDIGGLDKQIQELVEAIVLPMTHKERFIAIGIKPPKGCLMYGPPGTGTFLRWVGI